MYFAPPLRPEARRSLLLAVGLTLGTCGLAIDTVAQERMSATERLERFEMHRSLEAASPFRTLPWQHLGPTNISGRATDVAVAEPRGETYTMYVGAAGGGVWKTTNEGVTWENVFDREITASIGDIAIAPSDPEQVWVGTGEANIFRSSHAGAGIYRSVDGGESWEHAGLTETQTIARIVVHPTNPEIVWVAASGHEYRDNPDRGIYRTVDGGESWEKVLYVDEMTGGIDLVIHPDDPRTLYAATWQRRRSKFNDPRNEPAFSGSDDYFDGSGVWKSTDGGDSWVEINAGLPEARYRGRIGIDIARSSPETLYAFVDNYEIAREAPEGSTDAYGRPRGGVIRGATVFRSDDGGTSWRQTSQDGPYMESLGGTYGWVFGQMRVDPNDPDRIYVMGVQLHVSEDGGQSFRRLTGMHVDHHGLYIDPNNSDYLVNNNDGGAYVSYDRGENWRFFVDLPIVTFFNVNYDLGDPFRVYGSVQDHGSYSGVVDLSSGRHSIPAVEWQSAPGGEGSHHAIDPRDPNLVYSAGFYGSISRTRLDTNETTSIVPLPEPGEPPLRGQWLAHFILSPHDPETIYHGMNFVFRSRNQGDDWDRISPDLTSNDVSRLGDIQFQTMTALAESPITEGLLYAGTDDGHVHVMRSPSSGWTEISAGLHPDRFTSEIVASRHDESTVYVTQNGRRSDDFAAYVWRSTNYGEDWESLADNVPFGPVNIIREDPVNPDLLYLGTDVGVYVSLDGGLEWSPLSNGMPSTFVHDLVIHPAEDFMIAATHGQGMLAFDVRQLQSLTAEVMEEPVHLFAAEEGVLPPPRRGGFGGPGATSAWIHYWLGADAEVSLEIHSAAGEVVASLPVESSRGLHQVEWDLERMGGEQSGGFFRRRNFVEAGLYQAVLTVDGITTTRPVLVRSASAAARDVPVEIETTAGVIRADILVEEAPVTAENFLAYVDDALFDGGSFFRVVRMDNQPRDSVKIEVIQGGPDGPSVRDRLRPSIPLERTRDTGLTHVDGALSMARGGPDTARSQFFITIGDNPSLDFGGNRNLDGQGFAVFGRVTRGMEVVRTIQAGASEDQRLFEPIRIVSLRRLDR